MGKLGFDARKRWGDRNVVPRVEASGRWENFPICKPPPPTLEEERWQERRMMSVTPIWQRMMNQSALCYR